LLRSYERSRELTLSKAERREIFERVDELCRAFAEKCEPVAARATVVLLPTAAAAATIEKLKPERMARDLCHPPLKDKLQ
jgi:hypothetical protein